MRRWLADLLRLPKRWAVFLTLGLIVMFGTLDYLTSYDLDLIAFYLVPICWATWAVGRGTGFFLAAASAILCETARLLSGHIYGHTMIPVWNALMVLALFSLAVYLITTLKAKIAEHESAEKAKLQAERLLERQEKLAVLGTLTAGIAHEIRNPLTSLKARLYTLEKHLHALPAARKDTDIISAEISRLERIVQDALSFARPADPKLETLAADTVLREVHGLMATSLERRRVQLAMETHPDLFIRADSGHLKQVLINLVRNAADAIEGEGTITLRTRTARGTLNDHETDVVLLEVSDTGKGIPPEVERRLFDPFFSTKETGTGLGLPIALRMLEKQDGKLEYETKPGCGTTFSVVLPRQINNTGGSVPRDVDNKS